MDEPSRRPVQVDGDGAAKRRRLRRLRSWWRHEQQTVAAVLASAHHHSYDRKGKTKVVAHEGSEEVEYVPLDAQRGQTTPPPGERLAPLAEVAAPQGSPVAHCPVDGGLTLTVPVLAGRAAELVDSSALSKKTKRRRKKKLPRGGTRPRMVLPGRRLQRNTWLDSGTFLRQSARSSSVRCTRTLFLRPLVSGSLFFFESPAKYIMWNFLGDPFRKRSHIQRFLGYPAPRAVFLLWSLSAGPPPGLHRGRYGPEGQLRGEYGSDC